MKHFKPLSLLLALIALVALAFPTLAQDNEETVEEPTVYIGIFSETEDEIIFTTVDEEVFIIAPAGSFSPGQLLDEDGDEPTIYEISGNIVNEGDESNPPTLQLFLVVEYDLSTDTDGDGVPDLGDNCPEVANPLQSDVDVDGDLIPDDCDDFILENDIDNDGVADDVDNCPLVANPIEDGDVEQTWVVDTDGDGVLDDCVIVVIIVVDESDDDDDDDDDGEGFYCRNQDIEHPNGGRLAEYYGVDYSELIADFCGDDGQRRGWGLIRRELQEEVGEGRGNRNGNANGNSNGNRNGNGNGNGNSNGNGNGNRGNRNG